MTRAARLLVAIAGVASVLSIAPLVHAQQNPLAPRPAAAAAPFAGTFSGEKIKLELGYDDAQSAYTGWLTVDGQRFACGGLPTNGHVVGKFVVNGQPYDFDAAMNGDTLTLTSEGVAHALRREGGARPARPQNPLAGGGNPPQPNGPQQPNQPNPPQQPAGANTGIVGIAFTTNADGELVVSALMPGGPGEKAKVPVGGILMAVDGKNVEEMTFEQVGPLVRGAPGTSVTLSIDTDEKLADYVVQRVAAPAQPNGPGPQPMPQPPAFNGGDPQADRPANGLGILAPGLRVTYYMGSASMPGVRTILVQDPEGNWIDPGTGQHYAQADNPSTAGGGFNQLTIVAANEREIAADDRNYILMDPQQGLAVMTNYAAYVGTPDNFGDFWQAPAKLAQMRDSNEGGLQVRHMQYPVGGRTYNAIAITNTSGTTFSRNVYDTQTGLLIAQSASSVGAGQLAPNANGTASTTAGVTTISSVRLLDVHQLDLPWSRQGLPAWAKPNASLDFAGTYATVIQGSPALEPWRLQCRFTFGDGHGTWMPCKQQVRLNLGMGNPPQDTETARALGGSLLDPLWIDPQILAQLRPNTTIDDDKITKRKTTFLGVQNGMAVMFEQAPYEQRHYAYDLRTGTLAMTENKQQQGPATIVTKLQLAGQP